MVNMKEIIEKQAEIMIQKYNIAKTILFPKIQEININNLGTYNEDKFNAVKEEAGSREKCNSIA
jgi:hypothetical protein